MVKIDTSDFTFQGINKVDNVGTPGCTDPTAANHDATAVGDDGSCVYPVIPGCTNPSALNYDPTATVDDGSCEFDPLTTLGCTDPTACNYDPLADCNDGTCIYPDGCIDPTACNYDPNAQCDDGSCGYGIGGCTDTTACNYDALATCDDGSCGYDCNCPKLDRMRSTWPFIEDSFFNNAGVIFETSCFQDDIIYHLDIVLPLFNHIQGESWTYTVTSDGSTIFQSSPIFGGHYINDEFGEMIPGAEYELTIRWSVWDDEYQNFQDCHYVFTAQDYCIGYGCIDPTATNYDPNAVINDGSCEGAHSAGCTDQTAMNYDPTATVDDGSCEYCVYGCTVTTATNYNPLATCDDGSCNSPGCPHSIGDTHQGGLVFYVSDPNAANCTGLIAAPLDQSPDAEWGCYGTTVTGAQGILLGTGNQNTIDIEAECTTTGTAADICANLTLGGYSDWFLPSKDELNIMYSAKNTNVSFPQTGNYWSSTQQSITITELADGVPGGQITFTQMNAVRQNFDLGYQFANNKNSSGSVRAIRAF